MTFRSDTFTGLSKMVDQWLDEGTRYDDCESITFTKVVESHDYYWTATIKFIKHGR